MWLKCPLYSEKLFLTLLPAIFFELSMTRTFFDFPWRFELSGVDCRSFYTWRNNETAASHVGTTKSSCAGIDHELLSHEKLSNSPQSGKCSGVNSLRASPWFRSVQFFISEILIRIHDLPKFIEEAPVVQKLDSAIHQINRYPVDKC